MRDAEHLRARAREVYDDAKRAEYVDDGLLRVLEAIQLERYADELEEARACDIEDIDRAQATELAA